MTQTGKRQTRRERNRTALIEATLDCVAESGIADTSVSRIIARAGLSRGMIHLHFDGKDKLLDAAAAYVSAQYYETLKRLFDEAGPTPQEKLAAIVRSDLGADVLNERYVRIWHAFRGASRDRATIAVHSDTRDERLISLIYQAFRAILDETGAADASEVARDATFGLLALMEGMWADYLLHPDAFDRAAAVRIVFRFLGGLMPGHFNAAGPVVARSGG